MEARLSSFCEHAKVTQSREACQALADFSVNEMQQQKMKLDDQRRARRSFLKAGHALQKFMSTLAQFIKAYSGLSELAKGADIQYGGLVTGALSLLLQIGENKEGRETAITLIFKELESWIGNTGRLHLYSDAYPTSSRMEALMVDVYLGIGELAIESIEYYSRSPYARFWQAIRRPPKLGIDVKADEIKKSIYEVVSEGSALLVHTVAKQNSTLMNRWVQERDDQINHIARLLGINREVADPDRMIAQCKELHANAFSQSVRKKGTKHLQQISLEFLNTLELYNPPEEIVESSALIISGKNFDTYETGLYLCWLSPITTELAETYRSTQMSRRGGRVLFHSACSNQSSRFSKMKEPFDICLSLFIIQILLWDEEYFSQTRQTIEDDIMNSDSSRMQIFRTLLSGWRESDDVCLIIDRLDRIAPGCDMGSDEDDVSNLLEAILDIISAASCKIRLIVTIDASGWPQVRNDAEMEARWNIWRRRIDLQRFTPLFKIDWQQPEIPKW